MDSLRVRSLVAGLLYYSTHVTSVAAVAAYGGGAFVPSSTGPTRILVGVMLEVLLALGVVGTGVALLPVLRPHGESLAHAFSAMRIVEGAVIVAGAMAMLTLAWSIGEGASTTVVDMLWNLHRASFLLGQGIVISINSVVIGVILWRSGVVFPWIGMLGAIGGVSVLAGNVAQMFGLIEFGGPAAGAAAVPVFAFEIWFAGYLIAKGARGAHAAAVGRAVDVS